MKLIYVQAKEQAGKKIAMFYIHNYVFSSFSDIIYLSFTGVKWICL